MMNRIKKTLAVVLMLSSPMILADEIYDGNQQQMNANTKDLLKYLQTLGSYLGYDLTQSAQIPGANKNELFNAALMQVSQYYAFNTFLGAIPVATSNSVLSNIFPQSASGYSLLNDFANYTFRTQNYSSAGSQGGNVTASPLIDQPTYQQNPVSQALLNIMGTPDDTYCLSNDLSQIATNCNYLTQSKVIIQGMGALPKPDQYFDYQHLQPILGQVNVDSLIAPMLLSNQSQNTNTTSSPVQGPQNQGLQASSQAQNAANFIRYAIGALNPGQLPKKQDYDSVYNTAMNFDGSVSKVQQLQAQAKLSSYLSKLRTYTAQMSVPISNLYYLMSKRLPQNQSAQGQAPSSAAMSEFTMATWRLYKPDMSNNNQWINQINGASAATVQKEMAVLLAEINYQLYLNRQIQERILLTNSMMMLQTGIAGQPTPELSSSSPSGN